MIDFTSSNIFAKLRKVSDTAFGSIVSDLLIDGEEIVGTYQSIRDGIVFTNKRIISINVQGLTGKKKDFTSIPYNKITTFSVETAGFFDVDSELEVYMSAVGRVKFEFLGTTNVNDICKILATYVLR